MRRSPSKLGKRARGSKGRKHRAVSEWAESVRAIRTSLGMSQNQLARHIGVSFATVNRWENGHTLPSPLAAIQVIRFAQEVRDSLASAGTDAHDAAEEDAAEEAEAFIQSPEYKAYIKDMGWDDIELQDQTGGTDEADEKA